jgi:hypothetical protein
MAHLFAVFGVWFVRVFLATFLIVPEWMWYVITIVLSLAAQLLIDPSEWWWGFGIAGLSMFAARIEELLMLLGDSVRVGVLRRGRR